MKAFIELLVLVAKRTLPKDDVRSAYGPICDIIAQFLL
jgi:hypothetical protein